MVDTTGLETLLREIEQNEGVQEAMLVSLAGTYLAGSFPRGVHVDTLGSMFAVLVGSAETVTAEARDTLESVVIHSKSNKYLIIHAGRKALLVMRLPPSADPLKTKMAGVQYVPPIEGNL